MCQKGADPATGNDNNEDYDETRPGIHKGTMKYYAGSELYIEWLNQHGCGVDSVDTKCVMVPKAS